MDALSSLKVPVSLFAGTHDILATIEDVKSIKEMLGPDADYHYEEINADHLSFTIGKDMSYFTETVMEILMKHQPLSNEHLQ